MEFRCQQCGRAAPLAQRGSIAAPDGQRLTVCDLCYRERLAAHLRVAETLKRSWREQF